MSHHTTATTWAQLSAELDALRASYPGWYFHTYFSDAWADAAHPAGRQRLVAQSPRGVIISAWDAAELAARITARS